MLTTGKSPQRAPNLAHVVLAAHVRLRDVVARSALPEPSLSVRHAKSIPPADLEPIDETPSRLGQADTIRPSSLHKPPEWARPMAQPELGWYEDRPSPRAPKNLEWYAAAAGQALRINALDEAIDHAEHAITTCHAEGDVLGQMRLVQAIALRWLGHYPDAERCAPASPRRPRACSRAPARTPSSRRAKRRWCARGSTWWSRSWPCTRAIRPRT